MTVSHRCLCKNVPLEFHCKHGEPWSIRGNAGDEITADTRTASELDSDQNVNDRMPDLIRRWITGGRKQILLSFNCFLFWQQVIISSADVHILFYTSPRQQLTLAPSLIISVNCGHKPKLSTLWVQQSDSGRARLAHSFFFSSFSSIGETKVVEMERIPLGTPSSPSHIISHLLCG